MSWFSFFFGGDYVSSDPERSQDAFDCFLCSSERPRRLAECENALRSRRLRSHENFKRILKPPSS